MQRERKKSDKGSIDYSSIQIGKIKSTDDFTYNGKLKVWLIESNTNEENEDNWVSVKYASPFAGVTNPNDMNQDATESYSGTQKSYGFFAVPPDLNNFVICGFANSDPSKGYWFACLYADTLTHMIPGIAGGNTYQDGSGNAPAAEMHRHSQQLASPQQAPTRPFYEPLYNGLQSQGLLGDPLRGAGSASAWRNPTPNALGFLTPGGNQLIFDDQEGTRLIRLRTRSGAQILISEDEGHIYAISKGGNSWLELNNSGNIDVYGGGSFSVFGTSEVNVASDGNINLDSGANINIKASGDINIQSDGNNNLKGGGTNNLESSGTTNVLGGNIVMTGGSIDLNGPTAGSASDATEAPRKPSKEPFGR